MARIEALSQLNEEGGKAYLAEAYGIVIDNIQQKTISGRIKNKDLSGDPTTGSVEAKRFVNLESQDYGTARSGGQGQAGKAKPVPVALNVDKELIEECEEKDVRLYGVEGFINKKSAMHQGSMERELERAFFSCGKANGTNVTLTKTTPEGKVEEIIQKITKLKNDYIDGVDRTMIKVAVDDTLFGELRTYLDMAPNGEGTAKAEIGYYHGVEISSSVYLPEDVTIMGMVDGAIAQPVLPTLDEAGKFPASNAYHFGIFYSYGTEAVMPDTIFYA